MILNNVYGVKMTSLQEMRFSKYLDNNKIAMNTFLKGERYNIANNWLLEYKESKCCQAYVEVNGDVTKHYICNSCLKPCDLTNYINQ